MGARRVKLKVYGIGLAEGRAIGAVASQREFALLLGQSLHWVRGYGAETGNLEEMGIAMANTHAIFVKCVKCGHWSERLAKRKEKKG